MERATEPRVRPRAAIYSRISSDPEGREVGVQRQEDDCHLLQLGQLRDAGVVTEVEFAAKKSELLARL